MENQIKNSFDRETLLKIGRGALIAGGGVMAVYILEAITKMDFGQATPLVVGVASIIINAIKEWRKGQ
jgi:hypothetical protein